MKHLLILGILPCGASKRTGNLNSIFEKAYSQSSACDFEEKKYRNTLQNHLRLTEKFTESQAAC
jgi:hypothetical protein